MSYLDNPLFISYGLKYGKYDEDYPIKWVSSVNDFWSAVFSKFPDEYTTDLMIEEINKSGFHIEAVRDPNENLRGWFFPNEKERLLFSLKFGV
jgi:hypothetical protein